MSAKSNREKTVFIIGTRNIRYLKITNQNQARCLWKIVLKLLKNIFWVKGEIYQCSWQDYHKYAHSPQSNSCNYN